MTMTLEKELQARIFLHQTAVLGAYIMKDYMDKANEGYVKIPDFMLEDMADQYSNQIIQQSLKMGTFNNWYNEAWNRIAPTIPEHLNVARATIEE